MIGEEVINPVHLKLRHRAFYAGGWTVIGYGTNQLLRLAANLVLTRLLYPEAFGLMAIVQAVMSGIALLSDVGIEQSIIHNKKGHTADFINTAWSLQIMRGVLLWIATWLLAIPVAYIFHEPILAYLMPAIGVTALFAGLTSTKFALAERSLGLARPTLIDISAFALGLATMIIGSYLASSVWWLVVGNIVTACYKTIISHLWLKGITNRFVWAPDVLIELVAFGKWIIISSALTFFGGEGNRLLIGSLLDVKTLAFFTLALALDQFPRQLVRQIAGKVLFPAYSEVVRERPGNLYKIVWRSRLAQIIPYWLISAFFAYFGSSLIGFLYDDRYAAAGWMLQLMGLGSMLGCVTVAYDGILWAKGLTKTNAVILGIQLSVQLAVMAVGSVTWGAKGLVLGFATASWIAYPVHAFVYSRLLLWQPSIDLPVIALSILAALPILLHFQT